MELSPKVKEVIAVLKETVNDDPVIAIAGSHAKGLADEHSDIDIFMFTRDAKPYEERKRIIESICDKEKGCWLSEEFNYPWGGSMDFSYQGTPVEVVIRDIPAVEQLIEELIAGKFTIIPQTWTSNGYYNFIYLSEMQFLAPVSDPDGWLAHYHELVKTYPPALKKSIIEEFMGRAGTWMGNFHYDSAVRRADSLFVGPIVMHTLLDMVQVIFAINETYFTGDKKLAVTLKKLPYLPEGLMENLDLLMDYRPSAEVFAKQQEILHSIYAQLREKVK